MKQESDFKTKSTRQMNTLDEHTFLTGERKFKKAECTVDSIVDKSFLINNVIQVVSDHSPVSNCVRNLKIN